MCSRIRMEKVFYLVGIALKLRLYFSIDWNSRSQDTWWHGIHVEELPSQWSHNVLPLGDCSESGDTRVWGLGLLQSVLDCDSPPGGGGLSGYWILMIFYQHSHIFRVQTLALVTGTGAQRSWSSISPWGLTTRGGGQLTCRETLFRGDFIDWW